MGKKEPEGIALLSMYGNEEDDEDMGDGLEEEQELAKQQSEATNESAIMEEDDNNVDSANENTPPRSTDNSTQQQLQLPVSSPSPPPPQQLVVSESNIIRKSTITIVDYDHDEVALSPETEEGEIVATGRVMFGAELQTVNGTPGTVQALTPNTQATPSQSSEQFDPSQSDAMNFKANELESAELEEAVKTFEGDQKLLDPLDKFLPPPPLVKCPNELQEKIIKFLLLKKKTGRSFNSEVRNRKEYRNPDFLLHAVTYQDIDQIGSCFSKDVFDPHGYDKSDYYDEIEADMKRKLERKDQEKKKSQKVEFLSGGTQSGALIPTPKIMPVPAVPLVTSGSQSVSAAVEAIARDGRQNKKSKWDKVDGDRRNPLPTGGQDSVSSVGAHAALLSAANAGTGYTAFAQQRRREAEERRSSDKKVDRRT